MKVTSENYFSKEMSIRYMGVSQYKDFIKCEAKALAKLKGEYKQPNSVALLSGSYVHAWNESEQAFKEFKENTPELFKKNGELYKQYEDLDEVINAIKSDPFMMLASQGEKEVIMTGELFGAEWKIMIDNYNPDKGRFSDLKVVKSLNDKFWNGEQYVSFVEQYGYDLQMAIYSEIERLNRGSGDYLEAMIVAATKESPPDKAVIGGFDKLLVEEKLFDISVMLPRILEVKHGNAEPIGCGLCDYCRSIKKLNKVTNYKHLLY